MQIIQFQGQIRTSLFCTRWPLMSKFWSARKTLGMQNAKWRIGRGAQGVAAGRSSFGIQEGPRWIGPLLGHFVAALTAAHIFYVFFLRNCHKWSIWEASKGKRVGIGKESAAPFLAREWRFIAQMGPQKLPAPNPTPSHAYESSAKLCPPVGWPQPQPQHLPPCWHRAAVSVGHLLSLEPLRRLLVLDARQ